MPAPDDIAASSRTRGQTGFTYTPPTDDVEAVARGREAARRVTSGMQVVDWLDIGFSLSTGARAAAEEAGSDKGKGYAQAYARWLKEHGLADVPAHERAGAVWAVQNWAVVEPYLKSLSPAELARANMRSIKRRLGPPPVPRKPKPASELETVRREKIALEAALADTEDRFAASETDALRFSFAEAPESFAALIVRRNYTWAKRLHDTLDDILKRWVKRHQADEADMRPTL